MKTKLPPLILAAALLAGCAGPAGQSASSSPPPSSSQSPGGSASGSAGAQVQVQVDWSVLEGEGPASLPAVDPRWYEDYTDTLIPRPDYGILIPYAGALATVRSPVDASYDYSVGLYGLMARSGAAVMDPVCTSIYRASYTIEEGDSVSLPILVLEKGDETLGSPVNGALLALAAADGSWCTGFSYWGCAASPTALLAGNGERLFLLAPETGETVKEWSWKELGIDEPASVPWVTGDAYSCVQWTGDRFFLGCYGENWDTARFLDPMTGEVSTCSAQDWYEQQDQKYQDMPQTWWNAQNNGDGTYTLSLGEESHTVSAPLDMGEYLPYVRGGDRVIFDNCQGSFAVTDLEGAVILAPRKGTLEVLQGTLEGAGSWLAVCGGDRPEWDIFTWDGALSATIPGDEGSWCTTAGDLIEVRSEHMAAYYRPEDGSCVRRMWFGLPG